MRQRHGMTGNKMHDIWRNMLARCRNKNNKAFKSYGGRGIKVCERWLVFLNFYQDMGGDKPEGMTIDRIDNDKGYSPENCRWATDKEQGNNRRTNDLLTHDGVTKTFKQWAEFLGVPYQRAWARKKHGFTKFEDIFCTEKMLKGPNSRERMSNARK